MGKLYFEDIEVGMEIPTVVRGPMSMTTIVKFAGASGDFAPIHHDVEVAKGKGLPGAVIMGPLKFAMLEKLIIDWAGPDVLRELDTRLTGMDLVDGSFLIAKGIVTQKYVSGGNYAECEVWVENQSTGIKTVTGKAIVCLPSRKDEKV